MDINTYMKFRIWAFGHYADVPGLSLRHMEAWNRLHGDVVTLKDTDGIAESVEKMCQLYRQAHGIEVLEKPIPNRLSLLRRFWIGLTRKFKF